VIWTEVGGSYTGTYEGAQLTLNRDYTHRRVVSEIA
jgi:hypothetical protein